MRCGAAATFIRFTRDFRSIYLRYSSFGFRMAPEESVEGVPEHHVPGGKFRNPPSWASYEDRNLKHVFKMIRTTSFDEKNVLPKDIPRDEVLPVRQVDMDIIRNPPLSGFPKGGKEAIQATWIGHSSVLVQMCGVTFVTDPIWSDRCAPTQFFGPKRLVQPPISLESLKDVLDFVVISHNHFDHLDEATIRSLAKHVAFFVPLGLAKTLRSWGCDRVTELDWWNSVSFEDKVLLKPTPCQHWSRRGFFDKNKSLWCSWVVEDIQNEPECARFIFLGDSGYCPVFTEVGQRCGPFSLAAIPIGAYEPRWFMKPQHINPEEAVQVHVDLGAKRSMSIHWGTFVLTSEPVLEPPERIITDLKTRNLDPQSFVTLEHGETLRVPA